MKKKRLYFGEDVAKHSVFVEAPPPPPEKFISPFKSIKEWLTHICDTNSQEEIISEYHINLMELTWGNVLFLEGWIKLTDEKNAIIHRVIFKPASNMYFPLPKDPFENLPNHLMKEEIVNQLIEFTKSSKFQNSLLSNAISVQTNLKGQIWIK